MDDFGNKKLLTFSVAAYNMERYLREALESLVSSRYRDLLDVIVVNDGSTDATLDIANEYASAYPGVFTVVDKANGGYGSTINSSVRLAKGKYYHLLDADDWIDPSELDSLMSVLSTCSADAVVTKYTEVYEGSGIRKEVAYPIEHDGRVRMFDELDIKPMINIHMLAIKTSIIQGQNIHITENCFYTDTEFLLKAIPLINTLVFYDCNVLRYRKGRDEQSVSLKSLQRNYRMGTTVTLGLVRHYRVMVESGEFSSKKMAYVADKVEKSIANKYALFLTFAPKRDIYDDMCEFDSSIQQADERMWRDSMTACRVHVRLLRWSHMRLYVLLAFATHQYCKARGRI